MLVVKFPIGPLKTMAPTAGLISPGPLSGMTIAGLTPSVSVKINAACETAGTARQAKPIAATYLNMRFSPTAVSSPKQPTNETRSACAYVYRGVVAVKTNYRRIGFHFGALDEW